MKVIVGLGNPGREYNNTRHNFGFSVIDELAKQNDATFTKSNFEAETTSFMNDQWKILLVKPITFMNRSGDAVAKILQYYRVPTDDLLVVYDDIDLALGDIRTTGKSSAGHRGIQSIFDVLNTEDIARVRMGILSPSKKQLPTDVYVLQKFTTDETELKAQAVDKAISEINKFVS